MRCKFCYATFQDMTIKGQLPIDRVFDILDMLKEGGLKKEA